MFKVKEEDDGSNFDGGGFEVVSFEYDFGNEESC